ncbi:hypothetical protein BO70DRAFT_341273 [Aspergillus heteromorphus CBS 117.55]|uniref:NACHT domain-containing protein n=1 Tax=Aspergillus heteromorphus CBS 117.55 TaxID=1448321 RepID=A0A317VJA0_9EURO|nr:uncharacterized protein BO70DRAFT_341273 [Aspergillus heteromorphus CBS 117.55]PWY74396.1 hypothetical protein BO70DRAFT_341273 [Aspergillus heteromorphus CBS 117.55]
MLGKLCEKLCCGGKGERDDGTEENVRPVNLSPKDKDEVVFEGGKSRIEDTRNANVERPVNDSQDLNKKATEKNLKTQNSDQKDEVKCLEQAEHDGVDADVSPIRKQHPKEDSLGKDNELKEYHKHDEARTSKCPVSETTPLNKEANKGNNTPGNADLWQRAFDELDDDLKGQLREDKAISPENAIKEVIDGTKKSFEAYQNGGLKFKKRDGKESNVRDVAKKILNSAIECSEIVTGLAAFDPSGHASSAWTIISLGLKMATNYSDQREAAFQSSEFLADILARYIILDKCCRTKELPSSDGLDNAVTRVYKAILEYTAEVKRRERATKLDRMRNSIFPDSDTKLSNLQSAVEKQDQTVTYWSHINNILHQSTKADEILASLEKVYQNTQTILVKVNLEEKHKILDWLFNEDQYSKTQNDNQKIRTDNTGGWLLSSNEYKKWKITPGNLLWLHGPAGCGKSILCSTIIQDIQNHYSNDLSSIFAYWYFQFSRNETQDVKNMTRAIIRQLVAEELPESLVSLWGKNANHNHIPDQAMFLTVLDDVIKSYTGDHIFLILDALDECPDNKVRERDLMLRTLKDLINKHGKKIHLLATSRFEEDIRCHLEGSSRIDLERQMEDDVKAFVCKAFEKEGRLSKWGKNERVKDQIMVTLLDTKEPRRFRWTDLQIERLKDCTKEDRVNQSLKTIPRTLEETYRGILRKIHQEDQVDARLILTWLSFSLVPLKLEAVAAAVFFPCHEDVVKICTTSLVTVSPSDGTIKLAHFSVKEFLVLDTEQPSPWYHLTVAYGHFDIANRALDELLCRTTDLTIESADDLPLLKYSADYWGAHFSELTGSGAKFPDLEHKIYCLFEEPIVYLNWRRIARNNFVLGLWVIAHTHFEPPIYMACELGMQSVVERLLLHGADPCAGFFRYRSTDLYRKTFEVAAWNGHITIVKLLLENIEISLEIASSIVQFINLNKASREEVKSLLDILLSTEALYDKPANGCVRLNEGFVTATAKNCKSGHQIMRLLLNMQDNLEVPVTQRVLLQVIENTFCGEEMMRIICDRKQKDIRITENIISRIALGSGKLPSIATLFLQSFGATVPLDYHMIENFVIHGSVEVVDLLFQIHGDKIQVTEDLLVLVSRSQRNSSAVFNSIWKRASGIKIGKVLSQITAFSHGSDHAELLLAGCDKGYFLEQEIIQKVARHSSKPAVMRMLLDKREAGLVAFDVSQATMMAAASNFTNPQEMMELVINNANSKILISEEVLCSAVRSRLRGGSALKYLLGLDENLLITEEVIISAATNSLRREGILKLLFNKFSGSSLTYRFFETAYQNHCLFDLLTFWLEQGRHVQDCQLIGTLLEHGLVELRQIAKLLHKRLIELDDNLVDAIGTEKSLTVAFQSRHVMETLLGLQRNDLTVNEEAVLKALDKVHVDHEALKLLTDRLGSAVAVTQRTLEVAFFNHEFELFDLLLKEGGDWDLQKIWDTIWRHNTYVQDIVTTANTLLKYGEFDISQNLLDFLLLEDRRESLDDYDFETLADFYAEHDMSAPALEVLTEILLGQGRAKPILKIITRPGFAVPITETILDALWQNDHISDKYKVLISNILPKTGDFVISQTLLKFLPFYSLTEEGLTGESLTEEGLHELVDLYTEHDLSAPATEMITKILFELGQAHDIKRLFFKNPTFELTDDLLQLAERNQRAYKSILMPFLNAKRAADQNVKVSETKTEAEEVQPMLL